jgi:hypothetical protein
VDKKTVKKTKPSEGTADTATKQAEPVQKKSTVANLDNAGASSWDFIW